MKPALDSSMKSVGAPAADSAQTLISGDNKKPAHKRVSLRWGKGQSRILPPSGVAHRYCDPEARRLESAIFEAMGVMAAVLEEPYCLVGADELRGLVRSFGRLSRLAGVGLGDYVWRDDACYYRVTGKLCKKPLEASGVAS